MGNIENDINGCFGFKVAHKTVNDIYTLATVVHISVFILNFPCGSNAPSDQHALKPHIVGCTGREMGYRIPLTGRKFHHAQERVCRFCAIMVCKVLSDILLAVLRSKTRSGSHRSRKVK